jgi:hypothetical protein
MFDRIFGFGSSFTEGATRKKIDGLDGRLRATDAALRNRDALPADVQEALLSRSNRRSNRQALTNYLASFLDKP